MVNNLHLHLLTPSPLSPFTLPIRSSSLPERYSTSPPITQLKMDFKPHHLRPYSKYANAKCRQSEGATRISLIFIHKQTSAWRTVCYQQVSPFSPPKEMMMLSLNLVQFITEDGTF